MKLGGCLCFDSFVCSLCRSAAGPYAVEEIEGLAGSILSEKRPVISDEMPWNPDDLPEHLRGFGHRGADQDGFDGSEWVTPQEDFEAQMLEAARVLLDAREIT
jgi:hypothetical protein